ncbi:choice-of-anchor I family protein [Streptomyces sp. NBC_01498]|uniref:choice-of-anchor I family protein n=1 Tax=Streptomyces sp. NBC_01498 TaxID=2975870 RepID=UPI002E7BEF88|nr:choice-of-anchor I family protein [Streptomyces sp. NBC_01498]WTL24913.1 choice-of-anchor I family protein [Streptomyces sp. NBC_01498]
MKKRSTLLGLATVTVLATTTAMLPSALATGSHGGGHGHGKPGHHQGGTLDLTFLGRYESGKFDEGGAEITAYDARTRRVFTINAEAGTVDILDIRDPAKPTKTGQLSTPGANSVSVHDGLVAVAQEAATKTDRGTVAFFRASDGRKLREVRVGALPDMVTFTPKGDRVVVANEGEPDSYCPPGGEEPAGVDPVGSVSVIELDRGRGGELRGATARTAGFEKWDRKKNELIRDGVLIYGPNASVSQDIEPEYAAVSADGRTAWVTLQENNALAVVDLRRAEVEKIVPLGEKDHSKRGNGLDASDKDGVNIRTWPVKGLYKPDGIHAFTAGGSSRGEYTVSANEGDAREWDCFAEEVRVKDVELNPKAFPDAAALQKDDALGRLNISSTSPVDSQGRVTELNSLGGRSVSVRDERGRLVWDSGDDLEQLTAKAFPDDFNTDNAENDPDSRSDSKGPEPEGITTGTVRGTTYAFVGLERPGGVAVYDLSDPRRPRAAGYVNSRDFAGDPEAGTAGDLGPEGVLFVPAKDSPIGYPLLVVGNEISGTTSIYRVK